MFRGKRELGGIAMRRRLPVAVAMAALIVGTSAETKAAAAGESHHSWSPLPCESYSPQAVMDDHSYSTLEQTAWEGLKCCAETKTVSPTLCVHQTVAILALVHDRQARRRQQMFFGETYTSASGALALVIGGTKAAATTQTVWSVVALAPAVLEDIEAFGPSSQVHYGAAHAFARLDEHYRILDRRLGEAIVPSAESTALSLSCAQLGSLKAIKDKNNAAVIVVNGQIALFKTFCSDNDAALKACRPYVESMQLTREDLADKFAEDAEAIEGTFHKIVFGLQAPPSQALQSVLAAPFDALANAIRSGKSPSEYKARESTFQLEKDGLPLSSITPSVTAPTKPLSETGIDIDADPKSTFIHDLAKNDDAQTAFRLLSDISTKSHKAAEPYRKLNASVAALAATNGTYKMVFDFRAQKRTVDIEFTKASSGGGGGSASK